VRADVEAARRDFSEGVRLYQQSDFEGARRLFLQADKAHHAPAIVYNLALAEERLGHPQAAVDAYEAYVAEAGESGEFTSSATFAIAQIKARSTRLRIDSEPSGARLFVDGSPLREPAPTVVLVPAGHHVIVAQGDGWRAERDLVAAGSGDSVALSLTAPAAPPRLRRRPSRLLRRSLLRPNERLSTPARRRAQRAPSRTRPVSRTVPPSRSRRTTCSEPRTTRRRTQSLRVRSSPAPCWKSAPRSTRASSS
jgi:hypothetical protein